MPQDDANQEATEESRKPWKVESIVDFYVFQTKKNMMISKFESSQVPYKDVTLGILEPFLSHRFPHLLFECCKVCDFHDFTQFTHGCERCPKRIATPKYSATFKAHRFEGFMGPNSRSKTTNIHYEVFGIWRVGQVRSWTSFMGVWCSWQPWRPARVSHPPQKKGSKGCGTFETDICSTNIILSRREIQYPLKSNSSADGWKFLGVAQTFLDFARVPPILHIGNALNSIFFGESSSDLSNQPPPTKIFHSSTSSSKIR